MHLASAPSIRRLLAAIPPLEHIARGALHQYRYFRFKRALRDVERAGDPIRVVVGSSGFFEHGWLPTEAAFLNLLEPEHWESHFQPGTVDVVLAEHVWEHLTPEQGLYAAQTCYRFLRPGGRLRIAVPDGNHPHPEYIEHVRIGGTGPGADDHKVLYTGDTLATLLEEAGFKANLVEHYDAAGAFQRSEWNQADGPITRSADAANAQRAEGFRYTSLIADGIKPHHE